MLRAALFVMFVLVLAPSASAASTMSAIYGPTSRVAGCAEPLAPAPVAPGPCASFAFSGGSWFTVAARDALSGVLCVIVDACSTTGSVTTCRTQQGGADAHFGIPPGDSTLVTVQVIRCGGALGPTAGEITLGIETNVA